ncbi:hypothetical protein JTB14_021109, partial [Gonioctena quinquepunctata]
AGEHKRYNTLTLRSWMTKVVNFKKNCSSANIAVHTTIYCAPKNARPGLEHAHWDCISKSGDNENTGSFSNYTMAGKIVKMKEEATVDDNEIQLLLNYPLISKYEQDGKITYSGSIEINKNMFL